jgi:iron complex outermembrane receptor protein
MIRKELSRKWINTMQYTSQRVTADFSVYYNDIRDYVYIRPTGTRLTVRGYFPVFQYEQTDALLTGADAALKWKVTDRVTINSKFSYIYARDNRLDDVLIFIPPAQFENGLTYSVPEVGKLKDFYVGVSVPVTLEQTRAPMAIDPEEIGTEGPDRIFDFAPAPGAYALLNARLGFKVPIAEHSININLSGENILNTSYRNYMNRLRYYAEDVGSNFILRVSYSFLSH